MRRHKLTTRVWHWLNAIALVVLFMSGLNISNAHRHLYWGDYGFDPGDAWLSVIRFPAWATIPQRYDLAEARDWHNLSAWVFALALLLWWVASLANRHFRSDIAVERREWSPKAWIGVIKAYVTRSKEESDSYNALQKIAYAVVLGVLLPLMIFTGLSISPGFEPAAPWLVDLLGGRQSARSLHFVSAWAIFGFFVIHIAMVLVSGPVRQIGAMITGGKRGETNP